MDDNKTKPRWWSDEEISTAADLARSLRDPALSPAATMNEVAAAEVEHDLAQLLQPAREVVKEIAA
jgi:hypothetical protein